MHLIRYGVGLTSHVACKKSGHGHSAMTYQKCKFSPKIETMVALGDCSLARYDFAFLITTRFSIALISRTHMPVRPFRIRWPAVKMQKTHILAKSVTCGQCYAVRSVPFRRPKV